MKLALIILIILTVMACSTLIYAAASIPLQEHLRVIEAWKGQVEMLKWVGGAMVAGLVTAVSVLWAALNRQRKEQDQLSADVRQKLISTLNKWNPHERT